MPSNSDSGSTLITTLGTAQTLTTETSAGNYLFKINPAPLVADEILQVDIYDKVLTGDTTLSNLVYSGTSRGDQVNIIVSIPISTVFESIVQITQTNGTERTFDWAWVDMS